jgi:ubiquinone/menaquinone biosynthesis C-methylase UbiE
VSRLVALIYDRFTQGMEEACGVAWRRALLDGVGGEVLEIGAGTGRNLAHYRHGGVDRLTLTEPDPHMRRRLALALARSSLRDRARVVDWRAEALPIETGSIDAVVCTFVLCSVPKPAAALAETRRVLRPAGRLVFLEHVAAADAGRRAWQRRLEPVWSRLADGCHLSRDTAGDILRAGFVFDSLTRESARKALPIVRPTIRGAARPT